MSDVSPAPEKQKRSLKFSPLLIALAAISLAGLGGSAYFYKLYADSTAKANEQADIIKKVTKTVEVPNETPTVVTISNKKQLSNQQLAAKVNDGDVLLIFAQAKRLVVYRPSSQKVADILSFDQKADLAPLAK